jgi:hypothetical protein
MLSTPLTTFRPGSGGIAGAEALRLPGDLRSLYDRVTQGPPTTAHKVNLESSFKRLDSSGSREDGLTSIPGPSSTLGITPPPTSGLGPNRGLALTPSPAPTPGLSPIPGLGPTRGLALTPGLGPTRGLALTSIPSPAPGLGPTPGLSPISGFGPTRGLALTPSLGPNRGLALTPSPAPTPGLGPIPSLAPTRGLAPTPSIALTPVFAPNSGLSSNSGLGESVLTDDRYGANEFGRNKVPKSTQLANYRF